MLSVAVIRVEPGSTPGIGNTISEISFLPFSSFVGCLLLFARSHLILAAAALEIFSIPTYCYYIHTYRYLVLETTY